jgi:hypothetical protein
MRTGTPGTDRPDCGVGRFTGRASLLGHGSTLLDPHLDPLLITTDITTHHIPTSPEAVPNDTAQQKTIHIYLPGTRRGHFDRRAHSR